MPDPAADLSPLNDANGNRQRLPSWLTKGNPGNRGRRPNMRLWGSEKKLRALLRDPITVAAAQTILHDPNHPAWFPLFRELLDREFGKQTNTVTAIQNQNNLAIVEHEPESYFQFPVRGSFRLEPGDPPSPQTNGDHGDQQPARETA